MNTRLILISFLLILSSWSKAQEWDYPYTQYTKNDGLPSNTIYCVTSDKNGILWLGTDAGVVRFDGSKFKVFNTEDGLPSNDVFEIVCDSKNRLWLTTLKNDITFIKNESIFTKENCALIKEIKDPNAFPRFFEDSEKNLWITTSIFKLFKISKKDSVEDIKFDFPVDEGYNLTEYNKKLYFVSFFHTIEYDIASGKYSKLSKKDAIKINGLHIFDKYCYVINKSSAISRMDINKLTKGNFTSLSLNWNFPIVDSNIWITSTRGFRKININSVGKCEYVLRPYTTSYFHQDKFGNKWISTLSNGFIKLNSLKVKSFATAQDAYSKSYYSIFINNNRIYAGSINGEITIFNRNNLSQIQGLRININYLSSYRILKIFEHNDAVLIATDLGVYRFSKTFNTIEKINFSTSAVKNIYIKNDSIILLDNLGVKFYAHKNFQIIGAIQVRKRFYSYCDYKGKKVVGSQDSLYYIDKKFIPYPLDIHFNYRAVDLTTKDSLLIATTAEKGVFFIKDSTVVKNMNSTNGFSSNTCYKSVIYKDELFTATNKGINIYNFKTDSVFQLFESDGLPSNTVFDIQVYNDTIYAATEAGLSIIPISAIPHKRSFPLFANPVITNGDTLWNLPKIVSVYSNQPITFILNALSFGPKTPVQYHYRINGIDSNFKITTDQNLNLSKLEYGNYFLEAFAINSDGVRSNTLLISLIIKPYFYQTKLFKGFIVLLLGLALFLMISYMIRRSKKIEFRKNEEKNKMIFLELNAWRSAINPHFLFNSLNAIQGFFNQQDSNHTNKFIAQFSSILRKTIDQSGKILNKIEDEIIYLTQYLELEKIKRKNAFEFHIHCENEALKTLYIPTLVIQNIVENSIKHGAKENIKGNILITFSSKDDLVFCSITDNGNGFKPGEMNKETSKGFQLLKRKLKIVEKLIGRYIHFSFSNRYDTDQNIIGTEAIFTFPKLTFDYDFYRSNHRR